MKKVYCKQCKHFKNNECWYPLNITEYDSWDKQKVVHKKSPMILNLYNNCEWFEKR